MLHLYDKQHHIYNLNTLLSLSNCKDNNFLDMNSRFNEFVSTNSVFEVNVDTHSPIIVDFDQLMPYAPTYCKINAKCFDKNNSILHGRIHNGYFVSIIDEMKLSYPDVSQYIALLLKFILINRLTIYLEGTTDASLGLACMDFKDHFNEQDFIELLVHQVVHKLTFIDNRINRQLKPNYYDTFITTNFTHRRGGNEFSFYIGFHSFLVGIEILLFRKMSNTLDFFGNYHGSTQSIIEKSARGFELLQKNKNMFTQHGYEILERAFSTLNSIA